MKKKKISRQVSKTSIVFPHLVPVSLVDEYLRKSLPHGAAIHSMEVKFASLDFGEIDALRDACYAELYPNAHKAPAIDPYALDLELPKLGMKRKGEK